MKQFRAVMIALGVAVLCLAAGDSAAFAYTGARATPLPEWAGILIAASLLGQAACHAAALVILVARFMAERRERFLRSAAFAVGMLSLFLLAVDVAMLQDIGNELRSGLDASGEWKILGFTHATHAVFALLALLCAVSGKRAEEGGREAPAVKDEALFLSVHQIGICAAVAGFVCVAFFSLFGIPAVRVNGLLALSGIVIPAPYLLAVVYWLLSVRRVKIAEWYDEKQFADIGRGALVTLIVSVLIMCAFFLLSAFDRIGSGTAVWFPVYLFSSMLAFSGSTLYFSKRA